MAFFDDLKEKAKDLTQSGVAKSRQLAEIAKLKLANTSEEDAIKKAYIEIGKLYYAERAAAPEAAYVSLCEKITAAKVNIEENNNKIAALKDDAKDETVFVATDVPAEEPCSCCCDAPAEEPCCEDDGCCCDDCKPEE